MKRTVRTGLGAAALGVLSAASLIFGLAGPASATPGTTRLGPGENLAANERLVSPDGRYALVMQADGNLVERGPGNTKMWATDTTVPGSVATMMFGGQFAVVTPGNQVIWTTAGTDGEAGAHVELLNDGSLVVYDGDNDPLWSSGTRTTATQTTATRTTGTQTRGTKASATTRRSEAAITWFMQRRGETGYEGLCEQAVENAHGVTSVYGSARQNWNQRKQHQPYSAAPRGALVFYDTSANGHVAISLGDGRVVTTSANHKIGVVPIGYFRNPLGWASSPWS